MIENKNPLSQTGESYSQPKPHGVEGVSNKNEGQGGLKNFIEAVEASALYNTILDEIDNSPLITKFNREMVDDWKAEMEKELSELRSRSKDMSHEEIKDAVHAIFHKPAKLLFDVFGIDLRKKGFFKF